MLNTQVKDMCSDYQEYLRDESRSTGTAESISFPKSEDQVIQILKELYPTGINITLQGARTGLAAAAVPHGGHIMNLMKMNRVLGMRQDETGRFHVTVEPGVILSQLKKQIESRKFDVSMWDSDSREAYRAFCNAPEQLLTPDPTESSASIGGMVACNASGARSYLYGPTRNHVTGLRVVLTNGEVLSLKRGETFAKGREMCLRTESGKTMNFSLPGYVLPDTKNASGYYVADDMDAIDLFIGSDGTLGVTTAIELSLLPMPQIVWGVTCFFPEEKDALSFVSVIRTQIDHLSSIEFFNSDALQLLRTQRENNSAFAQLMPVPSEYDCAVYTEIQCDGEEEALRRLFSIGDAMKACGGNENDTWVARNTVDRDRLYFFRHATPESVNMLIDRRKKEHPTITKLGSDMSVPDAYLFDVMEMYNRDLRELGLESVKFGHIGNNHLHVNILPRNEEEYAAGKELFKKWAAKVTVMGGAVSAEHGIGKLKADFLRIMYGEANIREMARLKAVFDPKGTLGAGNLFVPQKEVEG